MSLALQIEAVLPQTQCRGCGYNGCRPYAQALASGQASIDKCPPGGEETLRNLGRLLKIDPAPYLKSAAAHFRPPAVAEINEQQCIGCTKCIQACPVDAIVGSAKQMHHILSDVCTGCGLCVEPCPVDCIEMRELPSHRYDKNEAKERYEVREQRLQKQARLQLEKQSHILKKTISVDDKQAYIQQALQRVKQKKHE
jgi:electron transport complex protein RnfB